MAQNNVRIQIDFYFFNVRYKYILYKIVPLSKEFENICMQNKTFIDSIFDILKIV